MSAARIGLFGGSFDPVHLGHIGVAEGVLRHFSLDSLRLIPCAQHALGKQPGALASQRAEMLELAIANSPDRERLSVDNRELARSGPSYSITTCQQLRDECDAQAMLCFIVGSDILGQLHRWHQWEKLISNVNLIIVDRAALPGAPRPEAIQPEVQALLDGAVVSFDSPAGQVSRIDLPPYPVSSTQIRRLLELYFHAKANGAGSESGKIRKQLLSAVDPDVLSYIIDNTLYAQANRDLPG